MKLGIVNAFVSLAISLHCGADPLPLYIINEYQTAPDSLERIEFHWFPEFEIGRNLRGWRIVTKAGTAWVSESIFLDTGYVVIDSSNTSGIFDLGDEEDYVSIEGTIYDEIVYPDLDPAPPEGASVSLFFIWYSDKDRVDFDHYIDNSPTFGWANDYPGCRVSGNVYNADDLLPIDGANLHFRLCETPLATCPELPLKSEAQVSTDSGGSYLVDSLYPLDYSVTVRADSSIAQTTWLSMTGALYPAKADFYLEKTGMQIRPAASRSVHGLRVWPNPFYKEVRISSPADTERLYVFDGGGRLVLELSGGLTRWGGRDSLGRDLPPGAYFIKPIGVKGLQMKKLIKLR